MSDTATTEVIRTDTGHMRVNDVWLLTKEVSDKAFAVVKAAGSNNPAFDAPPFCRTGCPYPDAILSLGCKEVEPPKEYRVECVFHDEKKPWRQREPIWPHIFKIDQNLHEQ